MILLDMHTNKPVDFFIITKAPSCSYFALKALALWRFTHVKQANKRIVILVAKFFAYVITRIQAIFMCM